MKSRSRWDAWNHPSRGLAWFQVFITIIGNIVGGSLLDKSDGFTRIPFAVGASLSYLIGFYFLAVAMRSLPVSTSYPVQIAGVISGTAFVGMALYGEAVSAVKLIAIVVIIIGAVILEHAPELRPGLEDEVQISVEPAIQPDKQVRAGRGARAQP
jgi:multidrug transporter EmrE-like cation transporter